MKSRSALGSDDRERQTIAKPRGKRSPATGRTYSPSRSSSTESFESRTGADRSTASRNGRGADLDECRDHRQAAIGKHPLDAAAVVRIGVAHNERGPQKRALRDRVAPMPSVASRHGDHHLVVEKFQLLEPVVVGVVGVDRGDPGLDLPVGDHAPDRVLEIRRSSARSGCGGGWPDRRRARMADATRRSYGLPRTASAAGGARPGEHAVDDLCLVEQPADLRVEAPSRSGERYPRQRACEQARSGGSFEPPEPFRDRRGLIPGRHPHGRACRGRPQR